MSRQLSKVTKVIDESGSSAARRAHPSDIGALARSDRPTVLFLCVHNAGRSQMAAGWLRRIADDRVTVLSAGSEPAESLNPVAVEAMREIGIDIAEREPRRFRDEELRDVDVVVTMGCGDACPIVPGARYVDWELPDPAGQGIEVVRSIRDEIERRVRGLVDGLGASVR